MTGAIEIGAAVGKVKAPHPLLTEAVPIDDHCVGDRWTAQDETQLARLIAIIAMRQAAYAAHILRELLPAAPAFTDDDLRREAKSRLTVQEEKKTPRMGYPRWQRDYAEMIRKLLTQSHASPSDRRVRFVGAGAYEVAGGTILRDLLWRMPRSAPCPRASKWRRPLA